MGLHILLFYILSAIVPGAPGQINPGVRPPLSEILTRIETLPQLPEKSLKQILKENRNGLPNIFLIGYWFPTNEMVRQFSPRYSQNPQGWEGLNWEGRGYNIYSFFPEAPDESGEEFGDFAVDYQRTSKDFWEIVPLIKPVAIMSFGRARPNQEWKIELKNRNLISWIPDFLIPYSPTPSPPDFTVAPDRFRETKFPSNEILSALKLRAPSLSALTNDTGSGAYLCEYLGYHLDWYRELYPHQVQFAAHTHIGSNTDVNELRHALRVSLRVLINQMVP